MSEINFLPTHLKPKEDEKKKPLPEIHLSQPSMASAKPSAPILPTKNNFSDWLEKIKGIFKLSKKQTLPSKPTVVADNKFHIAVNSEKKKDEKSESFIVMPPAASPVAPEVSGQKQSTAPVPPPPPTQPVAPAIVPEISLEKKGPALGASVSKPSSEVVINLISGTERLKELNPRTKLFIFATLTTVLFLFFGGLFLSLQAKVRRVNQEVTDLQNQESILNGKIKKLKESNATVFELQPRLENLKTVLANHLLVSKVFTYLEANTEPGVYYTDMSVDTVNNTVKLDGLALTYTAAARQLLIFTEDQTNVLKTELTGLSKEKEEVKEGQEATARELISFGLTLTLEPNFFK
jgi:hypothetical protein